MFIGHILLYLSKFYGGQTWMHFFRSTITSQISTLIAHCRGYGGGLCTVLGLSRLLPPLHNGTPRHNTGEISNFQFLFEVVYLCIQSSILILVVSFLLGLFLGFALWFLVGIFCFIRAFLNFR